MEVIRKTITKKYVLLLLYVLAVISIGFIRCSTSPVLPRPFRLPPSRAFRSAYDNCTIDPVIKLIVNEKFGPRAYWLEKTGASSSTPHTILFCEQMIPNTSYPFITPPNQYCTKAIRLKLEESTVISDKENTCCFFNGKNAVLVQNSDGSLELHKPVRTVCAVTLPPKDIIGSYPNPNYKEGLEGSAVSCLVYIPENSPRK